MQTRQLGSQGPEISVVGFGAWEAGGDWWGPNASEDGVIEAIRAGLDAGMTWVDTAEVYGRGRSEELVGRAIEGRRDQVLVFTKVGGPGSGTGYRPEQVRTALQASLDRLGTDHVDLYQIHWPDESVRLEDTWGAMADLADEGLTRWVGVSNFGRDEVERCLAIRHVDSVQNRFSLIHHEDRTDLLAWLAERGVGYLAYSPLGLGLLTGAIGPGHRFDEGDVRGGRQGGQPADFRPGRVERILARVDRLRPVADRLGISLAQLALRWVLEQDGLTAAIAGSRNPAHARSNAATGDAQLDEAAQEEIEGIFG
jgi:aryl-alcohol dehydrogenase-like predicted oxidoreductase